MEAENCRKGIILAGGKGKRLSPLTSVISKQLIPVFDKPMIYYPLSTLMMSGIKQIVIVTTPSSQKIFQNLLGNGEHLGIELTYLIQFEPKGVLHGILITEEFANGQNIAVALGDNIFHGNDLISKLNRANNCKEGATVFAYPVNDPQNYGVVEFNNHGKPITIQEKPKDSFSQYAVTGLYFYDKSVFERAKKVKVSCRGEYEISPLNQIYINEGNLKVEIINRGMAWLDTGTFDNLYNASSYIRTLEQRQGLKVGCPEEISWRKGWIYDAQLEKLANSMLDSGYGDYLIKLLRRPKIEKDLFQSKFLL